MIDAEAIAKVNRARRQLGLERIAPTTPEEFNAGIVEAQATLEQLCVKEDKTEAAPKPKSTRPKRGGRTRGEDSSEETEAEE